MKKSNLKLTSFHLSEFLHTELKIMCVLTKKSMGQLIRIALIEKLAAMKKEINK